MFFSLPLKEKNHEVDFGSVGGVFRVKPVGELSGLAGAGAQWNLGVTVKAPVVKVSFPLLLAWCIPAVATSGAWTEPTRPKMPM